MWQSVTPSCHCEERSDVGRKGAPPVAESSDRSGWAGTCLCTNEVQGKGLVPTRVYRQAILPIERNSRKKETTPRLLRRHPPVEGGQEGVSLVCV